MRCPNCGEEVMVGKSTWECGWCGDSGFINQVQNDESESDDEYDDDDDDYDDDDDDGVTITVTITAVENDGFELLDRFLGR